jgi:hypothetical protein
MKALRIQMKTVQLAGLILLFAEKLSNRFDDERDQTGILTSALNLTPAFPTFAGGIGNL